MCICKHHDGHQRTTCGSWSSLCHVGLVDRTWVIGFGGKHLCLLSHPTITKGGRRGVVRNSGACRPASLAQSVSSKFSERCCLRKQDKEQPRKTPGTIPRPLPPHTLLTPLHTCTHMTRPPQPIFWEGFYFLNRTRSL